MKSKAAISAILAISLSTASLAFAQRDGDRNDRGRNQQRDERGAGPNHTFHRGERLPDEYRHRNYVVDDWRGHQLSAPPRGYHWVQTGSDYVLVAIATGIIAQLLLGR
ncbi:MAG TPA: RcnB family protein [Burkholderiales bacterium]|jgi:Ni/Co efflux regulator RcnB